MLRKECVSKPLLTLLKKLQREDIFKDYFLVGGTSLALQIGHRRSDDIDKEIIGAYLFSHYKNNIFEKRI
jgi:hypothetical protein